MHEIRLELTAEQQARRKAAQMGACFQCGRGCKQPLPDCTGGASLMGAAASALRGIGNSALRFTRLSWTGVTALALFAAAYISLNS